MQSKRRRVDEDGYADHDDGADECDEEETENKLVKLVNTFFSASLADKEPDSKPRKVKQHKVLPVVVEEEQRHPEDDFDEELSFLFGAAVALEKQHDFRTQDALYAKNLPYIS